MGHIALRGFSLLLEDPFEHAPLMCEAAEIPGVDPIVDWVNRGKIKRVTLLLWEAMSDNLEGKILIPKLRSMRGLDSFNMVPINGDRYWIEWDKNLFLEYEKKLQRLVLNRDGLKKLGL